MYSEVNMFIHELEHRMFHTPIHKNNILPTASVSQADNAKKEQISLYRGKNSSSKEPQSFADLLKQYSDKV